MVHMQVREEEFVEVVRRNAQAHEPVYRAGAHVEDELVAIAQFDQEAGGGLLEPRHGHAGTAGDHPHLVGGQCLGARVVDIERRIGLGGGPLSRRGRGGRCPGFLQADVNVESKGGSPEESGYCQRHYQWSLEDQWVPSGDRSV